MEDNPQSRRHGLPEVAGLLALTLLLCGAFFGAQLHALDGGLGLPLDDSWIHLAFARNLAAGHGWGIQPGESVAGSTAPLWSVLVAVGAALPVPDLLWMEALGFCFHAGGVVLTWLLARRLGLSRGLAVLTGGLTAATGWLSWSALSGMEISLFVFLSLAGIVLHLSERAEPGRPVLSLPVLGLSVLARPEGLLLVSVAALDRLLRFRPAPEGGLGWVRPGRRELLRLGAGLAVAGAVILPVAAFYVSIGGSPLPTTLAAKTGGGGGLHLPDLQYLQVALGILFQTHPWMTLLAPVGAVALARRLGTPAERGLLPALWLFGLPLAYACLSEGEGNPLVGNFGRYLFPLLPLVVVLGVLGLEPLAAVAGLTGRRSASRRVAAVLAVALLAWPTLASLTRTATLYARNVSDIERGDVTMARWLAERLPGEAVVATMDIGALAAILPNPIVDLAGIASPEVHEHIRRARAAGESWQEGVLRFIAERRPDYLVVFPEWLTAVERPGSPFRRLHTIHVASNVTLGRDTLVLYATPWTRYPLQEPEGDPAR